MARFHGIDASEVERYGRLVTGEKSKRVSRHAERFIVTDNIVGGEATSSSDSDGEGFEEYRRKKAAAH